MMSTWLSSTGMKLGIHSPLSTGDFASNFDVQKHLGEPVGVN